MDADSLEYGRYSSMAVRGSDGLKAGFGNWVWSGEVHFPENATCGALGFRVIPLQFWGFWLG